jgi:tRNA nucleotidyltransferase/poly(A) polymerase
VLRAGGGLLVRSVGARADHAGVIAYLAGGAVRDRLRRRRVRDLDIAIEGDAVAFARDWARAVGGVFARSSQFGTATVEFGPGAAFTRVDFAATREETYPRPAALPLIRPAAIAEDLARRDFTINAMAIPLNGPARGRLLDPFGGRSDLSRGIVRMLHARSPQDDPTRAFRAARFAARFGFRIETMSRSDGSLDPIGASARSWRAPRFVAGVAKVGILIPVARSLHPSSAFRHGMA